jgi:hypothetical protein
LFCLSQLSFTPLRYFFRTFDHMMRVLGLIMLCRASEGYGRTPEFGSNPRQMRELSSLLFAAPPMSSVRPSQVRQLARPMPHARKSDASMLAGNNGDSTEQNKLLSFLRPNLKKIVPFMLAALLTLAPVDDALAARSGGRVGGRARPSMSRSASSMSRSASPRAAPKASSSSYTAPATTNVYVAPSVSYGGYGGGYGYGGFGGGFGVSPGAYLGMSLVDTLIREQQRQAYLQQQLKTQQELGKDQAMIQQLQAQLKEQDSKVDALKTKQASEPQAPAPASQSQDTEAVRKLQQQLMEQQKQIEALKSEKQPSLFPR